MPGILLCSVGGLLAACAALVAVGLSAIPGPTPEDLARDSRPPTPPLGSEHTWRHASDGTRLYEHVHPAVGARRGMILYVSGITGPGGDGQAAFVAALAGRGFEVRFLDRLIGQRRFLMALTDAGPPDSRDLREPHPAGGRAHHQNNAGQQHAGQDGREGDVHHEVGAGDLDARRSAAAQGEGPLSSRSSDFTRVDVYWIRFDGLLGTLRAR